MNRTMLILLLAVSFVALAASAGAGEGPYNIKKRRPVTVVNEGKGVIFSVQGGDIGGCNLLRPEGGWPEKVTLRLLCKWEKHYEGFSMFTDKWWIGGMGLRTGEHAWPLRRVDADEKFQDAPLDKAQTVQMEVRETADGLEFVIPARLTEGAAKIEVEWIDAYRR